MQMKKLYAAVRYAAPTWCSIVLLTSCLSCGSKIETIKDLDSSVKILTIIPLNDRDLLIHIDADTTWDSSDRRMLFFRNGSLKCGFNFTGSFKSIINDTLYYYGYPENENEISDKELKMCNLKGVKKIIIRGTDFEHPYRYYFDSFELVDTENIKIYFGAKKGEMTRDTVVPLSTITTRSDDALSVFQEFRSGKVYSKYFYLESNQNFFREVMKSRGYND